MHIVVTGACGKIGREAVKQLTAAGHRVTAWDIVGDAVRVDCADFGQVLGGLSGIDIHGRMPDAVLHLAGIPMPGKAPDHVIFANNTQSTYNVMSACARLNIPRLVWASSETVFGLPFTTPPDYVPLDEQHPQRPEWSYSLSKQLGESMADAFIRWQPCLSIASLRFSNVCDEADYALLLAHPERVAARKANLWSYIDVRDAARACLLALEASFSGHEAMIIAASDSLSPEPSRDLVQSRFSGVAIDEGVNGNDSLQSSAKAAALIGFQPHFSWRQVLQKQEQ